MKKHCFLVIISCLFLIGFVSCVGDNSSDEWRDKNFAFFEKVSNQQGVEQLRDSVYGAPGLLYKVIEEGNGEVPIIGNYVNVAYKGWIYNDTISMDTYINGTLDPDNVFEKSNDYQLQIGSDVIEGWNLILQQMPVGSKWRVYLPYYLGYGNYDSGSIPAYSTLIFDITMKEIVSDNGHNL